VYNLLCPAFPTQVSDSFPVRDFCVSLRLRGVLREASSVY
jgi:hypothetical protein